MKTNIKLLAVAFLSVLLLGFAGVGCNTSKGFGKDVEKLGDKIQQKAD